MTSSDVRALSRGAENAQYFTPAQYPPSGTAVKPQPKDKRIPKLFQPLKIRGVTFQNRIWVAPLSQYSAEDGKVTPWHLSQIGGWVTRGPGLTIIEGTAVSKNGRLGPNGMGEQVESLKEIVDFTHSQSQLIGIQLFHSGRKGSTVAPWLGSHNAAKEEGGWPDDIIGPSAVPYDQGLFMPRKMTLSDIADFRKSWISAVERSITVVALTTAFVYFWRSSKTLALQFLRVSATDWLEDTDIEGWTLEETTQLSLKAAELGVDFIDVSSGGSHPAQIIKGGPAYQAGFSKHIKDVLKNKAFVGAVGTITNGVQANDLLDDGLDAIFNGRLFQKNPGLVWSWADDLGIIVHAASKIQWAFKEIPNPLVMQKV